MELLQTLSDWQVAGLLRRSAILYPLVNAAHILGIALLFGAIATLDLRLLGAFRGHALGQLGPPLQRVAAAGLAVAAVTGALLFTTRPLAYAENPAFLLKLGLVALGVVNAALLHRGGLWRRALAAGEAPAALKAAALLSLLAWIAAVLAGRWIGFLQ
ncbi:MAG TPA: DUF2214 domain-containing protein [Falsiroseomonas sp.]|nr:DUF2214 domain-containing protein [Falsiroseomonas sp.]